MTGTDPGQAHLNTGGRAGTEVIMDNLNDKIVLITGGSGSLGHALVEEIQKFFKPHKVIIFSRDECKQYHMAQQYKDVSWLRFLLGDVRDKDRLLWVLRHVDYVIHAAALKQIPALEYNPLEGVKTNINGSANVVEACLENEVKRAVLVSTDKAYQPVNLYGATKMAAERLFIAANSYNKTQFRMIRYGNVLASRGSVVELFLKLKQQGIHEFPITHPEMTRFWFTLPQAAEAVLTVLTAPDGTAPIYIPRLPSMRITDLARAIDPDCTFKVIGRRPGEKLHETLCEGYSSDKNREFLSWEQLRKFLKIP